MKCCFCAGIEHYESLAELGFGGIELSGAAMAAMPQEGWEAVKNKIVNGPIPCVGFNAALPPEVKICGPGFDPASVKAYAELVCQRLHELGGRTIGIGSPKSRTLPEGFDPETAKKQMEEFLVLFAGIAASWDVTVCWETLNRAETNFGLSFAEDGAIVRRLADQGVHHLGLVADLFHMLVKGTTAAEAEAFSDLVRHVHIAEPPVNFRGYPTESYASRYQALLEAVLKNNSCDTISIETMQPVELTRARDALGVLRRLGR